MSLAESFLSTAKDILLMSENIKRVDSRVDQLADDLRSLDRRLMKIELLADLARQQPTPRRRGPKELP
jgi:hypothetical protein